MSRISMNPFLRAALGIDAAASGTMGVALSAAPGLLANLFNLPHAMLVHVGAFLIVYGVFVALLAMLQRPPASLVWLIIVGNAGWVIASLVLLASGSVAPSLLGYAFVIVQAIAVGVFAELQFIGVRRAVPAASAA
jgi:hypothetical protein